MVALLKLPSQLIRSHAKLVYASSPSQSICIVRAMATSAFASSADVSDITASPASNQHIRHDGKDYTTIKEGLAYILVPQSASVNPQTSPKGENEDQTVFYNPIQQFNRDLSVLAIKAYGEEVVQRKRQEIYKQKLTRSQKRKRDNGAGEITSSKSAKLEDAEKKDTVIESVPEGNGPVSVTGDIAADQSKEVGDQSLDSTVSIPKVSDALSSAVAGTSCTDVTATQREPSFKILDALSATGLRALRYAHEIPFVTSVTANDMLKAATAAIDLNVQHNKLSGKIKSVTGNAMSHMYSFVGEYTGDQRVKQVNGAKYDVIDLDPYGTAATFLDAAVQAVRSDGGLLCVTCTDSGVWASNGYPEKAYSLYGGTPIKGLHCHEGGVRLILNSIASTAARYGLAIEPLLSLSIDYYARVFVRIQKSPENVKFLAGKTMIVYSCDSGCGAWKTQLLARNKLAENKNGNGTFYKHVFAQGPSSGEHCEHCGVKTHLAGPMYAGPLHSAEFIGRILADLPNLSKETYGTTARIEGMLNLALEELLEPLEEGELPKPAKHKANDPAAVDYYPFYFIPSALAKVIHCVTPHENALRGALRHLGYRATRSHAKAGSIKTDAPWSVVWEIMREWVKQKAPIKEGAVSEGTAGYKILAFEKDSEIPEIVFDEDLGRERDAKKLLRYQVNPRENWGPMNRAKGGH